jgi:hypothetical protein
VTAMGRMCRSERTCLTMADAKKKLQPYETGNEMDMGERNVD